MRPCPPDIRRFCSILALAPLLACAAHALPQEAEEDAPKEQRTLEEPLRVAFRLIDGNKNIRGTLERWDSAGISGTFGTHGWDEIELSTFRRIFQRVMDRKDAGDWILYGELQLRRPEEKADRSAKIAFDRASRIDPTTSAEIESARARALEVDRVRNELERMRATEKMREGLPEGVEWTAKPWPALTDAEQAQAIIAMKEASDELLTKAGYPDVEPIETEYFLLYSDLSQRGTTMLARDLDEMYADVGRLLGLPQGLNLFWGKASILICSSQDQFRLIEAQAFNQMTPRGVVGLCHCVGPRVFVNMYHPRDDYRFASTLVHETVHGIMHRYLSPQRLPTWANEGFSEYIAANAFRGSPVDASRRPQALDFIRRGGSISQVMAMNYKDGSWPGNNAIGYAVGYVMCDLMIRQHPDGFAAWVRAIKAGKEWRKALTEEFGSDPDRLARITREWHQSND